MAVSDLTGTTWVLNSTTANPSSTIFATLNFSSNSQSFVALTVYDDMDAEQTIAYREQGAQFPTLVYEWGWSAEAYRTISITGGDDVTNATFIAWLEANAEQQQPTVPDVAISYAGAVIASLTDSGTKTLKTQGKFCESDITIGYTKSGGGGGDVIVFYVQSLTANNTLYVDPALTTTAMEFYEYDLATAWSAVSAATAIKLMSGYGTTDEQIVWVTEVEYDRPEDSIDLSYNEGYNNARHTTSIM